MGSRNGTKKRTGGLLIAAALCVVGIPLFVILHQAFYAVSAMARHVDLLGRFLGFLGGTFLLATFACPVAAIVCLIWALIERSTRRSTVTRRNILIVVSALAAVVAVIVFSGGEGWDRAAGYNGSFELVKAGDPVNWHVYRRPPGEAEMSYDTADKVDGAQSIKFVVREADPMGSGWRNPGLFQISDAEEGRPYRISFWLKTQGAQIRLQITSDAPEQWWVPRTPTPIIQSIGNETGVQSWHQFSYNYTVPSNYSNIRFEMNVVAPGTAWIDNVRIDPL